MKLFKLSNLSETARIMMAAVLVICFALLVLGLVVINILYQFFDIQLEKNLPFITGMVFGCLHSVIKVVLMEKSLDKIATAEKESAKAVGILLYMGRMVLTIAVLALAVLFRDIFGWVGTIAGVLSLQLSAYAANIVLIRREKKNKSDTGESLF